MEMTSPRDLDSPPEHDRHEGRPTGPGARMPRRRFLKTLGAAGVVGGLSYLTARAIAFRPEAPEGPRGRVGTDPLDDFVRGITSGGPPKDGIPSIDQPRFAPPSEAGFLSDDDVVFGLVHAGESRAYPQLVLVWHEIVNDRFPDGPMTVTYCPLTGSAVAFRGALGGRPYTFGTSGDLVNSNLLMYDRQTDSRWPQILAQAILGTARPRRLEEISVDWTTWGRWRAAHRDTSVLTTQTGYVRNYGQDPYGSYSPVLSGYYEKGSSRAFPVMREDPRFDDKEVFIGVKLGEARLAVRKSTLRSRRAVRATMSGQPVAVLYDEVLDEGRAYHTGIEGRRLTLKPADRADRYVDDATGSLWDPTGRAVVGPRAGSELRRLVSYDVMWFAWAAFFPDTAVAP